MGNHVGAFFFWRQASPSMFPRGFIVRKLLQLPRGEFAIYSENLINQRCFVGWKGRKRRRNVFNDCPTESLESTIKSPLNWTMNPSFNLFRKQGAVITSQVPSLAIINHLLQFQVANGFLLGLAIEKYIIGNLVRSSHGDIPPTNHITQQFAVIHMTIPNGSIRKNAPFRLLPAHRIEYQRFSSFVKMNFTVQIRTPPGSGSR